MSKRTSRKPKRTSRRPVHRNRGFWASVFGPPVPWGYALYDKSGKLMLRGVPGVSRHPSDEAQSVAYFGWEHVPGVKTAIAFDTERWPKPPARWTRDWEVAAYNGIDGMHTWGGGLADELQVSGGMLKGGAAITGYEETIHGAGASRDTILDAPRANRRMRPNTHNSIKLFGKSGNAWIIRSNYPEVKQVFFGWADGAEHPELYGRQVDRPRDADKATWEWRLDPESRQWLWEHLRADLAAQRSANRGLVRWPEQRVYDFLSEGVAANRRVRKNASADAERAMATLRAGVEDLVDVEFQQPWGGRGKIRAIAWPKTPGEKTRLQRAGWQNRHNYTFDPAWVPGPVLRHRAGV